MVVRRMRPSDRPAFGSAASITDKANVRSYVDETDDGSTILGVCLLHLPSVGDGAMMVMPMTFTPARRLSFFRLARAVVIDLITDGDRLGQFDVDDPLLVILQRQFGPTVEARLIGRNVKTGERTYNVTVNLQAALAQLNRVLNA